MDIVVYTIYVATEEVCDLILAQAGTSKMKSCKIMLGLCADSSAVTLERHILMILSCSINLALESQPFGPIAN